MSCCCCVHRTQTSRTVWLGCQCHVMSYCCVTGQTPRTVWLSCQCHVMSCHIIVYTGHRVPELSGWAVSVMSCHVMSCCCVHRTQTPRTVAELSVSCHVMLLCTQDTDSQNCLAELSVSLQVEAKSDTTQPLQFKVHTHTHAYTHTRGGIHTHTHTHACTHAHTHRRTDTPAPHTHSRKRKEKTATQFGHQIFTWQNHLIRKTKILSLNCSGDFSRLSSSNWRLSVHILLFFASFANRMIVHLSACHLKKWFTQKPKDSFAWSVILFCNKKCFKKECSFLDFCVFWSFSRMLEVIFVSLFSLLSLFLSLCLYR